jgi:2,4-dienoyl-CoA reductase-like NADH-dependent reductase (Old Yellow Enzyme family)/thioredoxin reductase
VSATTHSVNAASAGHGAHPLLLSSFQLGPLTLKNRVVWLPHLTRYADDDGLPSEQHVDYYAERARNGVALIITGCETAHPASAWGGRINAYDDRAVAGYRRIAEAVHEHGAFLIGQITDDGNQQDGVGTLDWHHARGPSAIADHMVGVVPHALTTDEIAEVVRFFGASSETHRAGGFDGIEIKAAHDGLHRQFLSPLFNHREDQYGGSVENRLRFLRETVEEIRRRAPRDFVVGVRLSLDEGLDGGYGPEDGVAFAREIGSWGTVDYLNSDRGSTGNLAMMNPTMAVPQGYSLELSGQAREASGLPTIAFGRIKQPGMAEAALAAGQGDLIGMARPLITDPQWLSKVAAGHGEEIRPCIGCNQGCVDRLWSGLPITCILNPAAGREGRWGEGTLQPAASPARILVVGGGPAGLKSAEIAARRGHDVTVVDRRPALGGKVGLIRRLAVRAEFGESTDWIEGQLRELGVTLVPGTDLHAADFAREDEAFTVAIGGGPSSFDEIVVATGSRPVAAAPELGAHTIVETMEDPDSLGDHVLLWDAQGDQSAATAAELLATSGHRVTLVTGADGPAGGLGPSNAPAQLQRLAAAGVRTIPYHAVARREGRDVALVHAYTGAERRLAEVDDVVAALGWLADDELYLALARTSPHVRRAGDCVAPRDVGMAIFSGEQLGREL